MSPPRAFTPSRSPVLPGTRSIVAVAGEDHAGPGGDVDRLVDHLWWVTQTGQPGPWIILHDRPWPGRGRPKLGEQPAGQRGVAVLVQVFHARASSMSGPNSVASASGMARITGRVAAASVSSSWLMANPTCTIT